MRVRFTAEYLAGIFTGAGAAWFFLALGVQGEIVSPEVLSKTGSLFAGLALIVGGGGMKLRSQAAASPTRGYPGE